MTKLLEPFASQINLQTGILQPAGPLIQRRLSDMRSIYADAEAVEQILATQGDRLIYEVYAVDLPEEEGQVLFGTTIIYPGRIGNEFHMTKGHFHAKRDRGETYFGLAGQGALLLQTEEGTVRNVPMQKGTVAYVPPYWAHRTANTGDEPFIFFAAWPGDAGHDYATIEERGFAQILVAENGSAVLAPNPRYGRA